MIPKEVDGPEGRVAGIQSDAKPIAARSATDGKHRFQSFDTDQAVARTRSPFRGSDRARGGGGPRLIRRSRRAAHHPVQPPYRAKATVIDLAQPHICLGKS